MKKIAVACSLIALMGGHALAADLGGAQARGAAASSDPWTGVYVAAGLGFSADSIDTGAVSLSADGLRVVGRVGYDKQFGNVVAGPFADIAWTNAKAASFAEADLSYAIGGRVGVVLGGSLVYANAGWEWQDFNKTGDLAYHPDGFFAGGGIEASLGNHFSIGVESRHSWRSDAGLDNRASTGLVLLKKTF